MATSLCVSYFASSAQLIHGSPSRARKAQHVWLSSAAEGRRAWASSSPTPSRPLSGMSKAPTLHNNSLLWGRKAKAPAGRSRGSRRTTWTTPRAQANEGLRSLAIAVGVPVAVGAVNALINNPFTDFYRNLKKPWFNPPNWLFGSAWSVLYVAMGLASWLVWAEGGLKGQAVPLTAYGVQLVLNLLWPPIFFTAHNIRLAFMDLVALVVAVVVTIVLFKPVNPLSAYLLLPYLAWVSFAAYLNYSYLSLNGTSAPSTPQAA